MKKPSLLLVGYGRFGAFAAALLRRRFTVHILETRRGVRLRWGLKRASVSDLGGFDLIIFALPALRLKQFLESNGSRVRNGAFVADLCAVKIAPLKWLGTHLPAGVSYAGLHPLFGPDTPPAGEGGHPVAVCRGRSSPACHLLLLRTIVSLGLKPIEMTAVTHDKSMSSSLFLTQFIGETFPQAARPGVPGMTTAGFEHLRIIARRAARNSPDLIRDLYRFNPYCPASLGRLVRHIQRKTESLRNRRDDN